jgi:UDP-N-acetylmuramate dehydrogenase
MSQLIVECNQEMEKAIDIENLSTDFGDHLQEDIELARFTAARIGGKADALLIAKSADDLASYADHLWQMEAPFIILGGGSNVLISDAGVRGVVIINRARKVRFHTDTSSPEVWAESGVNFGSLARQAAGHGLSGLEWAVGIPGTLGGAIVGNAGAHGADMSDNLLVAEILHHKNGNGNQSFRSFFDKEQLAFEYRSSKIKREPGKIVVLSAELQLHLSTRDVVQKKIDEFSTYRHRTQPAGASLGSMFKNPPGEVAGRLIDQAGLKGTRIGDAEISNLHANFFINHGNARAVDVMRLINLTREKIMQENAIELELEIELIGDWDLHDPI